MVLSPIQQVDSSLYLSTPPRLRPRSVGDNVVNKGIVSVLCAVCGRPASLFLALCGVPALQNILAKTPAGAVSVPKVDANAVWCSACEHVSIAKDGSITEFDQTYDNRVSGSALIQSHYRNVADQIEALAKDKEAVVVEIGCGRGELLREIRSRGFQNIIGYDPTMPDSADDAIVPEYWARNDLDMQYDFVILRHVLEEIPDPRRFLVDLLYAMDGNSKMYIEITNNVKSHRESDIFTIYPEYYNLYSVRSITELLFRAGLTVLDVHSYFGGAWLGVWAASRVSAVGDASPLMSELRERIVALPKPVVLWGAGGRGCNILNFCSLSMRDVSAVVDTDPSKWGKYISGTGHPVVAPADIAALFPKSVLVANSIYIPEIEAQVPAGAMIVSIQDLILQITKP